MPPGLNDQSAAANSKTSSIAEAVAVANQISGYSARSAEFERLVRLAIRRNEYGAALSASEIFGITKKDELLDLIHCYASFVGDTSTAKTAFNLATGINAKNSMLIRTVRLASARPGEGSNDAQCKVL